jgi:para-aminobenzoate synthetase component 1
MATLWAGRFEQELVFDLQERRLWLEHSANCRPNLGTELEQLLQREEGDAGSAHIQEPMLQLEPWQWHTNRQQFAEQVEQIRAWIASGDLFQANLTACCQSRVSNGAASPVATALSLYARLRRHCPAPFAGLAIGGGAARGEAVLCSSPERFLRRHPEGLVETRPIKGTRPRSNDAERDAAWAAELVSSPKDRAENVMIVDLLRNDLGRVCQPGTIQVPQLVGLESYPQVHHLTSVIEGQLLAGVDVAALLRACWPGGSISGAPKIRACQRLAELEPVPRGPYCGSLFRLGSDGSFDSNILIRSLMLKDGTLWAHAGCGIVADSDPQAEAEEMGWKIQPLLDALVPAP